MEPKLSVTFNSGSIPEMTQSFEKDRSSFPYLSIKDYFTDPEKALTAQIQQCQYVLAFRFKLQPDGPDRVWYFIKTGEVARIVLNAPRYGIQEAGHPWGEGPLTSILRSTCAVDKCPGAGTNNVMTSGADKHEEFRKPLREEFIKGLNAYIPKLAECIYKLLPTSTTALFCDVNSFSRSLVQNTVLELMGFSPDVVTMEDISNLNVIGHEMAKGVEGAADKMRVLRETIDRTVVKELSSLKEESLFRVLQKKGYSEVACRETIIVLMIGARNGSTALIHLIWLLSRNSEMQEAVKREYLQVNQDITDWTQSLNKMHILRNLFRYSLNTHSPVKTINRNAINPMILTIKDEQREQSFGIFPGDKVDYLMYEAAKVNSPGSPLTTEKISLSHIPFSVGPNQCPASHLIEAIVMMTAGMLINRFQLECDTEKLNVIPNVFVNEFVDEPIFVNLRPL